MGIALEVYRTCRETVESHGGGRLERVRLAVGELSAVEPELLVYAWEAVIAETPDTERSARSGVAPGEPTLFGVR